MKRYKITKPYQIRTGDNKILEYPIGMILGVDKTYKPYYTNATETPHNFYHLIIKPEVVENNLEYFEEMEEEIKQETGLIKKLILTKIGQALDKEIYLSDDQQAVYLVEQIKGESGTMDISPSQLTHYVLSDKEKEIINRFRNACKGKTLVGWKLVFGRDMKIGYEEVTHLLEDPK